MPPEFTKIQENLTITEGNDALFECHITGEPEPKVVWYKGSRELILSADFVQSFDGKVAKLLMKDAYCDDSGPYSLLAKNSAGETRCQWHLNVRGKVLDSSGRILA